MATALQRIRAHPARAVAVLALAGGAAVLALLLAGGGGSNYRVTAVFDHVEGLVPGADVEAAGVPVGSVESIAVGSDGLPHVTLSVNGDFRLRRGAVADLRALSASGEVNRFVSL